MTQTKVALLFIMTLLFGGVFHLNAQPQRGNSGRGGAMVDKSQDLELQALIAETLSKFKALNYVDHQTGDTMSYNLFIPDNYDQSKEYPLVMFIADASTTKKDVSVPLTQGYGGVIWASAKEQEKNPCFVLVPQYKTKTVDDDFSTTYEVEQTIRLLKDIVKTYSIDQDRIYKTGQSMGGMMSLYYGINYPELFAASIYVGCQWDASKMSNFTNQHFFYIVAEGDMKAPKGRDSLTKILKSHNTNISQGNWSAKEPREIQEQNVQNIISQGNNINYITFDLGSVLPENGGGNEHMNSFDYAYKLEGVRDWLFQQKRK